MVLPCRAKGRRKKEEQRKRNRERRAGLSGSAKEKIREKTFGVGYVYC